MSSTTSHVSDSTAIRQQQRAATAQAGLRLGERLRQLRVAAGMTQTELAGDRFSKEYVSQIERGKTRPTGETVHWLAQRLGVDAGFLANGVSADERGRVDAALDPGGRSARGAPQRRGARGIRRHSRRRPRNGHAGARSAGTLRRGDRAHATGRRARGGRAARPRASPQRGPGLLGRRACRGALPARCRPLQAQQHPDGDRALRRGAQARRALRPPVGPASLEHAGVALALLSAPPRPRGRA